MGSLQAARQAARRAARLSGSGRLQEPSLGTCACDGIDSVLREQKTFLEAYPDHAKAGEIKARGAQLRNDPDAMPVNCR